MASPLEGALARAVGKALNSTFLPAKLTKYLPGGGPAYDPLPPIPVDYKCRGVVEAYADAFRLESLVEASDRKVMLLASSLKARPEAGDTVTLRGQSYTIITVSTDPAEGVWTVQARS